MIKAILIIVFISALLVITYYKAYKTIRLTNIQKELLLIVICFIAYILWILALRYLPGAFQAHH